MESEEQKGTKCHSTYVGPESAFRGREKFDLTLGESARYHQNPWGIRVVSSRMEQLARLLALEIMRNYLFQPELTLVLVSYLKEW
jgi:hypothetical protein